MQKPVNIIFLHHSTGNNIWRGNTNRYIYKIFKKGQVQKWFAAFNKKQGTHLIITDRFFPKAEPYGWKNYPYDYYNLWVKNGGQATYNNEPTLENLVRDYQVIIFKHCFPVSNILEDTGNPNVDSEDKRLENYKLQYQLLKEKMHAFPQTTFIVWTNAALAKGATTPANAQRAKEFHDWVVNSWDEKNDNIHLFDFYNLETEGGLYLKEAYGNGGNDSHPNPQFSATAAPLFCQRIVDIVLHGKD